MTELTFPTELFGVAGGQDHGPDPNVYFTVCLMVQ